MYEFIIIIKLIILKFQLIDKLYNLSISNVN